MEREIYIRHLTRIASFLVWQEDTHPDTMYGGWKIRDAVNSLAAIMGCDPVELREGLLLKAEKAGDDRHD
jgi:hypothetical protein